MTMSARARRGLEWAAVACALAVYVVMAVTASMGKANAFDELAHLTAGHAYWTLDDYRLQPENGNWPQRLGALPSVLHGAVFASTATAAWQGSDVWTVGDEFFFDRGNDIDRNLIEGRALIALLGACLGAIVFVWARRIVGPSGAWVALLLFVASPTLLAHGALVTSDMAAALGFLAATGAIWRVLHRVTIWTVVQSTIVLAGLLLAKFSGLLMGPIAIVLVALRLFLGRSLIWRVGRRARWRVERRPSRQFAIVASVGVAHLLVAVALIWASYGFRYSAFAEPVAGQHFLVDWPRVLGAGAQGDSLTVRAVEWARAARVLPEAYLYGFSHTMTLAEARRSFLNGVVSLTGRVEFFPYAFLVKSTLPFLALCALGLAAWVRFKEHQRRRYQVIPLVVLILVYGGAALTSNLNIGHRHLLPLYPALMIVAGASAWWGRRGVAPARRPIVMAAIVVALGAWHLGESLSVRPNYLAYFNELVGGPSQGYRHLVDSSLDWGQDLPALKAWIDQHRQGPDEPVYLSYFGSARPAHFGIQATLLPGLLDRRPPARGERWGPGLYAVSATMLSGVYLSTAGRWDASEEAQYQQVQLTISELINRPEEREAVTRQSGQDPLPGVLDALDRFRIGRLTAYLRRRVPLAQVADSILIYRLTEDDLTRALTGPL